VVEDKDIIEILDVNESTPLLRALASTPTLSSGSLKGLHIIASSNLLIKTCLTPKFDPI